MPLVGSIKFRPIFHEKSDMGAILLLAIMGTELAAHGQSHGIGLAPAQSCPCSVAVAPGAVDAADRTANLQARQVTAGATAVRLRREIAHVDTELNQARLHLSRVLPPPVVAQIEEHRRFARGYNHYYDCPARPFSGLADARGIVLPDWSYGQPIHPVVAVTPVYPPDELCFRMAGQPPFNAWARFVHDGGYVSSQICEYNIPSFLGRPPRPNVLRCQEGLNALYLNLDRRAKLESLVARAGALPAEALEGRYCPYCSVAQRRDALATVVDSVNPVYIVLDAGHLGPWRDDPGSLPPSGGQRHLARPYPAVTPGYFGVREGVYGALPGSIGRGAFCCHPTAAADPFQNPFDRRRNPAAVNDLFAPGFGPGFAPVLGNGIDMDVMLQSATISAPVPVPSGPSFFAGTYRFDPLASLYGPTAVDAVTPVYGARPPLAAQMDQMRQSISAIREAPPYSGEAPSALPPLSNASPTFSDSAGRAMLIPPALLARPGTR